MQTAFQSSFEEGSYDYQGILQLTCPTGWTPHWVDGSADGILHRPEYDLKDRQRGHPEVRTGRFSASFYTIFATHDACLCRKFRVAPGKLVRASVWAMNVTNSSGGRDGGHGMRVGIDPTGGEDHTAPSVVYGGWWSSYMPDWREHEWRELSVETAAEAEVVTVFLHAKCDYAADINASHWDDFQLQVGEAGPQPSVNEEGICPTLAQIEEIVRRVVREELDRLREG
ncbi:MAG TPA: hypothetical protein VM366_19475 [Anaerolineae bacterium]|nr:hypothetical protein [Anaerolineae bacterium]